MAEALHRLPGISVANDQGEGRYVIIRGVNPNLANVTVNGATAAAARRGASPCTRWPTSNGRSHRSARRPGSTG